MFRPLINQLRPLRVVLRWIRPARVNFVVARLRRPRVLIRLRLDRKLLRHETNLRVRPHAAFKIRVEDTVHDGPVVDRSALGILAIRAGGTPLQRRRPIAGREQVVRAKEDLLRRELAEFADQLLPVLHVGVIRLVRAEEAPDGFQLGNGLCGIDCDGDGEGCKIRRAPVSRRHSRRQAEQKKQSRDTVMGQSKSG